MFVTEIARMKKMLTNTTDMEDSKDRKISVLLVEDDQSIVDLLTEALHEETSYHVASVPDGFQALRYIRTIKPELFLLDYALPSMNGLELYDQIRSIEGFESIPVVFMSAAPPEKVFQERNLQYIKKPFDLEELFNVMKHAHSEAIR